MARRRKDDGEGVSLFPFLSILACLIGILTLMISLMSRMNSSDTAGQSEEDIARAKKRSQLVSLAQGLEVEIDDLDKRIKKERASSLQLAKLRDERQKLEGKSADLKKQQNMSPDEIKASNEKLQQEIASLVDKNGQLEKKAKEIKDEITARKAAPDPPKSVQVRPGGSGNNRPSSVFFVECSDKGINLYKRGGAKPQFIPTDQIAKSPAYQDYLSKIKRVRDPMVLYLIRRSGYSTYRWAANEALTKHELRTGKLPLPNDGKLDLSAFE